LTEDNGQQRGDGNDDSHNPHPLPATPLALPGLLDEGLKLVEVLC
jgi:hypothetical protein